MCSSVAGYLGGFHLSEIVNSAAMNFFVQVFVWTKMLFFFFLEVLILFSKMQACLFLAGGRGGYGSIFWCPKQGSAYPTGNLPLFLVLVPLDALFPYFSFNLSSLHKSASICGSSPHSIWNSYCQVYFLLLHRCYFFFFLSLVHTMNVHNSERP